MADNKTFDIDFSFKKNNIDELFFNLSENPDGFKNKDFRYTLSLIYQTVEDEFKDVFLSPYTPARNTNPIRIIGFDGLDALSVILSDIR